MSEFKEFGKITRLNRDVVITEKIDGTNAQILIEPFEPFPEGCSADEDLVWQAAIGKQRRDAVDAVSIVNEARVKTPESGDQWEEHVPAGQGLAIYAGSRNRWLKPGKDDNFGFAAWVSANAKALVELFGPGRHFGEWWGAGVQRRYGLTAKRFSLFNVSRYGEQTAYLDGRCLTVSKSLAEAITLAEANPGNVRLVEEAKRFAQNGNPHAYHKGVRVCQCRDARAALNATVGGVQVDSVPVLYRGPWHGTMWLLDPADRPTIYDVMMTDEKPSPKRQPRTGWAPALALQKLETEGSAAAPGFMDPEGIVVFHEASGQLFKATIKGDEKPKGEVL